MAVSIGILINYRNRKNKKGLYPIHIRVTIDNNPQYYLVDLPVKVSMEDWTGNDLFWVAETNPYNLEINEAINQMRTKIIDLHRSLYSQKRKLSFYHIDKVLGFKGNREVFNDYFKNYMRKPPPTVVLTDITWEKYDAFIKHLDKFNPALRFDEIDWEMVARIRNYLAQQRGRKGDLPHQLFYCTRLLEDALKYAQFKHHRHLRYLAENHAGHLVKIRFVLQPFSFVFLLEGIEHFHIVLETLDTEEASYLWHIPKRVSELPQRLAEIDRQLDIIRKQGRQGFLTAPPENFSRVLHDYSDDQKGFILWKHALEERLV